LATPQYVENFRSFYLRYFTKLLSIWQAFSYPFLNFFQNSSKKPSHSLFSSHFPLYDGINNTQGDTIVKLSDLSEKNVYANKNFCGVCRGVGISLKSHAVRYLLCASTPTQSSADFSVGIGTVISVGDSIILSRLRPSCPKSCAKISIGLPIYSFEGGYLGTVSDLDVVDFIATTLYTDRGETFPVTALFACSDAVILRKEQPYPLGQRIPAPMLPLVTTKTDSVVTKAVLRTASAQGSLVKLTLSLPPFGFNEENFSRSL